jgi:hypothetical protein
MLKKHMLFAEPSKIFQLHPSENEPEYEEALIQLLENPPTNSNHQSTFSKELKFKKSSTAYILRKHWVMTSSLVKFLKNCRLLD